MVIVYKNDPVVTDSAKLSWAARFVIVFSNRDRSAKRQSELCEQFKKITVALRLSYTRNPQFSRVSSELSRCELSTVIKLGYITPKQYGKLGQFGISSTA